MEKPNTPRSVTPGAWAASRTDPAGHPGDAVGVGVREGCLFQVATDAWLPLSLSPKRKEFLPSPFLVWFLEASGHHMENHFMILLMAFT